AERHRPGLLKRLAERVGTALPAGGHLAGDVLARRVEPLDLGERRGGDARREGDAEKEGAPHGAILRPPPAARQFILRISPPTLPPRRSGGAVLLLPAMHHLVHEGRGNPRPTSGVFFVRCVSPLLALSGHAELSAICPLSGVKRT